MKTRTTLKQPPPSTSSLTAAKLAAFADYVDRTWIAGDYSLSLWTHFDNTGPRTTNLTEGWHNGLNSKFSMPHPSHRSFLHYVQKCQYEVQARMIQLKAGQPPKHKRAKLAESIVRAKLDYGIAMARIFYCVFPIQQHTLCLMRTLRTT